MKLGVMACTLLRLSAAFQAEVAAKLQRAAGDRLAEARLHFRLKPVLRRNAAVAPRDDRPVRRLWPLNTEPRVAVQRRIDRTPRDGSPNKD